MNLAIHLRDSGRCLFAGLLIASGGACVEKKVESPLPVADAVVRIPDSTLVIPDTALATVASSTQSAPDRGAVSGVPTDPVMSREPIGTRLVDTTETQEYQAYKVEVTIAGKVDTIPGVLTFDMPVVTADGILHGPIYTMDGEYRGIYSYQPHTHVVSEIPLPADAARWDSEVKLSPDAAHIAYMGGDSTGERGFVRTWPAGVVVLRTPSAPGVPGDFSFNQVRWVTRDSVAFSWRANVGLTTDRSEFKEGFVRVYTSLSSRRFTVDTLSAQPHLRDDRGL